VTGRSLLLFGSSPTPQPGIMTQEPTRRSDWLFPYITQGWIASAGIPRPETRGTDDPPTSYSGARMNGTEFHDDP
jgi:hypothetical protein